MNIYFLLHIARFTQNFFRKNPEAEMRRGGLFRGHGSADEVEFEISGYEWMRMFKFMNNKWLYILTLGLNIFQSSSSYITSIVQGKLATILVDSNYETAEEFLDAVNNISAIMLATISVLFVFQLLTAYCESKFMPQFLRDLRVTIMTSLLEQDVTYFDEHHTGVILSRLTDDVSNAYEAYTMRVLQFVRVIFQWISGLVICLWSSWRVTIITLFCLPFYALSQFLGNKYVDSLWLTFNDRNTKVSAKAEEILTSFRTVRSFDAEIREYQSYKEKLFDVHEVVAKTSIIHGVKEFMSTITHWGMTSFVLYYTGKQAVNHEIEPGTIVTLMSIIHNWSFAFSGIFSNLTEFKKSNVAAAKLLEITDRVPLIKLNEGRQLTNRVSGSIEFKDVSFMYPTREEYAVKNLSFKVNPGETIALVGESGCGKSTTLQLLQRFYDVGEGQILIDGIDIREINPISLRTQIAIVPQGPVIFSMNVKDNIRFGKPEAPREEVVNAATVANAHSFIRQLKNGYKTLIRQNSLSGGQKQRICIARAVMMDAPILLLDEATAALDTESERLVQDALSRFREGKTAIIVAHRLATVRHASRILVIDHGSVIEEGTHEELLARSGAYAHLVQHQLQ
ncbi:ABC transporter family protein [Tritrichomonas foetus]|uniref:ABC transporter family protein n=1 Tax=Tritrichomonas foetus TaxID=1144522 RepID=A0A1J4KIY1_9EUKA|nr:ABC transporter family protein [Tritrichomonas foetus]|eukprot:OHT11305.1 ABC transporter family protein [Tritrichomonas foetus]